MRRRAVGIEVSLDHWGDPVAFGYAGRRYAIVRILAAWREAMTWWREPDGSPRLSAAADRQVRMWRVEARGRGSIGVYDLACYGDEPGGWRLVRVVD